MDNLKSREELRKIMEDQAKSKKVEEITAIEQKLGLFLTDRAKKGSYHFILMKDDSSLYDAVYNNEDFVKETVEAKGIKFKFEDDKVATFPGSAFHVLERVYIFSWE